MPPVNRVHALPVSSRPCASSKGWWSLRVNLVANAGQPHKEVSLVRFDTESPSASALRFLVGRRRVAIAQVKSSAARGLYAFCLAHGISRCGDNPQLMVSHVLTLATRRSCFLVVLGRSPPVCLYSMDTILRLLEGLRRDELVWLHAGIAGDSVEEVPVAALAERVGDFNISMDPWEQTGAAPQGWASHAPDCDSSPGICSTTTS